MLEQIIVLFFCMVTVVSALAIVFLTNLLHAVLSFICTLLGVAILFVFANAEFVAVSQIMIYSGGILILILFGVMLTSRIGTSQSNESNSNLKITSLLMLGLFIYYALKLIPNIFQKHAINTSSHQLQQIGVSLLTEHLFTFEAVTILLTMALIGAVVISKSIIKK